LIEGSICPAQGSTSTLYPDNQPAFTLLSHDFNILETETIIHELLLKVQAEELHFAKLKRRPAYRKLIIDVLNHDLIAADRVYFYTSDKRFIVTVHLIDRLLEYVANEHGIKLFEQGQNITSANLLHFIGLNVIGESQYRILCQRFLNWVKTKEQSDSNEFYNFLADVFRSLNNEFRDILGLILSSKIYSKEITAGFSDKYTLDPTVSMFKASCNFWGKKYKMVDPVYVDESKPILYHTDLLNFYKSVEDVIVGYGKNRYSNKLSIGDIFPLSSATSKQIQLADLLVSSINHAATAIIKGTEDEFTNMILTSKLFLNSTGNSMWPTLDVTPESIGMEDASDGIDPLDQFVKDAIKQNYRPK
jgi:hypothetical protein